MDDHIVRCARGNDGACVHEYDPVGHFPAKSDLMGDDQHGHSGLRQFLHDAEDFANQFRIQSGGGFVEEQDLGVHGQGSGDGDPLLLAAGQLVGIGVRLFRQSNPRQKRQSFLAALFNGAFLNPDGALQKIL